MIDTITRKPIVVDTYGSVGGYLEVPEEQLGKITALLDANQVSYWVDEETLSIDGGPETARITLSRRTDPTFVQRLLDSVP
jgi:hypothetical protein